jgi:uncharacterized membrane protein YtjA (UPF0391 family)
MIALPSLVAALISAAVVFGGVAPVEAPAAEVIFVIAASLLAVAAAGPPRGRPRG